MRLPKIFLESFISKVGASVIRIANSEAFFKVLLSPDNGYIKDDTIKLEVTVNADAPHGVQ